MPDGYHASECAGIPRAAPELSKRCGKGPRRWTLSTGAVYDGDASAQQQPGDGNFILIVLNALRAMVAAATRLLQSSGK